MANLSAGPARARPRWLGCFERLAAGQNSRRWHLAPIVLQKSSPTCIAWALIPAEKFEKSSKLAGLHASVHLGWPY